MRTPSLIAQCLPGLVPQDRGSHSTFTVSERDVHLPSPAVEIIPSKMAHPYKYAGDSEDLQGLNVFKGRISVADIIGFAGSEMISSKPDGFVKSWDSSIDLVNVLKHEIRDGQLSFRGKRVLELGCSYGLPGIFACLKGAATVHFQDLNAETIRCTTIPNVLANLEQARDRQIRQPESPLLTPSRQSLTPVVHFYAGDWEELPTVLSAVRSDTGFDVPTATSISFSEEDFMDACSSQDGSIIGHGSSSSRRSRKLSRSRASDDRVIVIAARDDDAEIEENNAQVALMRCHEKLIESEEAQNAAQIMTRLLVCHTQAGCIIGKGGKIIKEIREASGATIKILTENELPICALHNDRLVQITGDTPSLIRALKSVSKQIRENPSKERPGGAPPPLLAMVQGPPTPAPTPVAAGYRPQYQR